jgi:hypothetical protein
MLENETSSQRNEQQDQNRQIKFATETGADDTNIPFSKTYEELDKFIEGLDHPVRFLFQDVVKDIQKLGDEVRDITVKNPKMGKRVTEGVFLLSAFLFSTSGVKQSVKNSEKVSDPIPIAEVDPTLGRSFIAKQRKENSSRTVVKSYHREEIEDTSRIINLASAEYISLEERVIDPKQIMNMKTASELVNKYFQENSIKAIPIEPEMKLHDFMEWVTEPDNSMALRGFRYLEAMNYFKDNDIWVQPRQGREGGGACDIATLIKRTIVENYNQIGTTENWFGHKVERWGPFVIVYYNHTPYPNMAKDMIAVSSPSGSSKYKDFSNTEFFVFLVDDGVSNFNVEEVFINIQEKDNNFYSNLLKK